MEPDRRGIETVMGEVLADDALIILHRIKVPVVQAFAKFSVKPVAQPAYQTAVTGHGLTGEW